MRSRHVVATVAVLGLGGILLGIWPLSVDWGAAFAPSLLLTVSVSLVVSARVTSLLGPWRGAIVGWFVGALVPLIASLASDGWAILNGQEPYFVQHGRYLPPWGWLRSFKLVAVLFGAVFAPIQLAPRSSAVWRRLFVALLMPWVFVAGLMLSRAGLGAEDYPFVCVAIVVTVIGCLRGVDHPSDVLRPFRRMAQRMAGLEPRDPEFDLDAVEPLGGRRRERA